MPYWATAFSKTGLLVSTIETQPLSAFSSTPVDAETAPLSPWLGLNRSESFFENDEISNLLKRGLFYARSGVPIHFQGTAGRGKTSLALEIAHRLGRKVCMIAGNDWLGSDDLIGREVGQSTSSVVDKYIQRVRRSESTQRYDWQSSSLADAMENGHTLVYDEFTRSSAKANGILLSVLEEGVLLNTNPLSDSDCITAHPEFRIILTSNPSDYAGLNATPDALMDRMVTFRLARYSAQTESGIVAARTGLNADVSHKIVRLVHDLLRVPGNEAECSMRAAIMIAQIAAMRLRANTLSDALLSQIAADVLNGRGAEITAGQIATYLAQTGHTKQEVAR